MLYAIRITDKKHYIKYYVGKTKDKKGVEYLSSYNYRHLKGTPRLFTQLDEVRQIINFIKEHDTEPIYRIEVISYE